MAGPDDVIAHKFNEVVLDLNLSPIGYLTYRKYMNVVLDRGYGSDRQ